MIDTGMKCTRAGHLNKAELAGAGFLLALVLTCWAMPGTVLGVTWTPADMVNSYTGNVNDAAPCVVHSAGKWICVWSAKPPQVPVDWPYGSDADIFLSRSDALGQPWSPQVAVNPGAEADSTEDTNPQLAADENGHCVLMWQSDSSIKIMSSADYGTSWSAPIVIGTGTAGGVATDRHGQWVAVWESSQSIYMSSSFNNGATWTTPLLLLLGQDDWICYPHIGCFYVVALFSSPKVAADGSGAWRIIVSTHSREESPDHWWQMWQDASFLVSKDDTLSWTFEGDHDIGLDYWADYATPPAPVDRIPDIASDGSKTWVAVSRNNGHAVMIHRTTNGGATWGTPKWFTGNLSPARVHVDGAGNWMVVFTDLNTGVIYYSHSTDGSTWSDRIPLAPGSQAELAASDTGIWRTVYSSNAEDGSSTDTDIFTRAANLTAAYWDELTSETFLADVTNPTPGGTTGWTPFGVSGGTWTDYDGVNAALRVTVSTGTGNRINGWMTGNAEWLPYAGSVGPDNVVRGKFHVFRSGQDNMANLNEIPNMRLRLSNRFAVNSMLEVFNHLSGDITGTAAGRELFPSVDAVSPSTYRVDFDPVDVPALGAAGEGISAGFEAYSLESQENGSLELAEVEMGVYPGQLLADSGPRVKAFRVLACTASDAGDLKVMNSLTDGPFYRKFVLVSPGVLGAETGLEGSGDPACWDSSAGVTLDSTLVPGNRMATVIREFTELGAATERMRVEPMSQYVVRWHVTSSTNANRNPQLRLRARALKYMWSQKLEIGGALAAGNSNNTIAQQALPGVGCANPDQSVLGENGGWYTMIMHTPMSPEIQLSQPLMTAQPGPGDDAVSTRDIKLGVDLLDTISGSAASVNEKGQFTVDRIEIRAYDLVPD